jgi:hypothetical protein
MRGMFSATRDMLIIGTHIDTTHRRIATIGCTTPCVRIGTMRGATTGRGIAIKLSAPALS